MSKLVKWTNLQRCTSTSLPCMKFSNIKWEKLLSFVIKNLKTNQLVQSSNLPRAKASNCWISRYWKTYWRSLKLWNRQLDLYVIAVKMIKSTVNVSQKQSTKNRQNQSWNLDIPQLSSSELSGQSIRPSQRNLSSIHLPLPHLNWVISQKPSQSSSSDLSRQS